MLQLVQPAVVRRHLRGEDRLTGADEPRRLTPVPRERRTHQHRRPVTYATDGALACRVSRKVSFELEAPLTEGVPKVLRATEWLLARD
jgi:hypothetical protein